MIILSSIKLIDLGGKFIPWKYNVFNKIVVNRKIINWHLYFVSDINILSKCVWCMKNKIYYYRLDRIFFGDLLCLPPELLSLSLFLLSEWLLLCLSLDDEWCPFLLLEWWLEPWRLFWGDLKISKTICNWYFYSRYQKILIFWKNFKDRYKVIFWSPVFVWWSVWRFVTSPFFVFMLFIIFFCFPFQVRPIFARRFVWI